MLVIGTGPERKTKPLKLSEPEASVSPILFLDIDGVLLAGRHWREGLARANNLYPKDTIHILNGVCFQTDCRVVVTSTHRKDEDFRKNLRKSGFHGKFHEDWRTPVDEHFVGSTVIGEPCIIAGRTRGSEVAEWLLSHPETCRYAIIDDEADYEPNQRAFLIQTAYEIGITPFLAGKLVSLLSPVL